MIPDGLGICCGVLALVLYVVALIYVAVMAPGFGEHMEDDDATD